MTFKKIAIIFSVSLFLTGCREYRTFSESIKVTFFAETSITTTNVTEGTTISVAVLNSENIKISTQSDDQKVYYTKSGKSFHYANPCGRGTYFECTLDEAVEKGLEPCKKCVLQDSE